MDSKPWYRAAWAVVDSAMQTWSDRLRRILRLLRLTRALLVVGILAILASAVVGLLWPRYFPVAYAVATVFMVVPLVVFVFLVGLPLRARSVVRLVDMGYPANARELAIRVMARKLHEESIATEELLWDTAVNEGRKFVRKMEQDRARRKAQKAEGDEPDEGDGPDTI